MKQLIKVFLIGFAASLANFSAADPLPWSDDSCYFSKKPIKDSPKELLQRYLKENGNGSFINSSDELETMLICPGHEPGADLIFVVDGYEILDEKQSADSVKFKVKYKFLGTLMSAGENGGLNAFDFKPSEKIKEYEAKKTPYGWRLRLPDIHQPYVLSSNIRSHLLHKKWAKGEKEKFDKVIPPNPCAEVNRKLSSQEKSEYAPSVAKQLKKEIDSVGEVKILESLRLKNWQILKVDTKVSDEAFLFYSGNPSTNDYISMWSGGARINETPDIEKWVKANVRGIPQQLSKCFSWLVTNERY